MPDIHKRRIKLPARVNGRYSYPFKQMTKIGDYFFVPAKERKNFEISPVLASFHRRNPGLRLVTRTAVERGVNGTRVVRVSCKAPF
jgi:hypothetical protein